MVGPIHSFLADDHLRLSELLDRAICRPEQIDLAAYAEFRAGLLRHIAMEEKVLLPLAQNKHGNKPLPIAARLRLDHGALAAPLCPRRPSGSSLLFARFWSGTIPLRRELEGSMKCAKLAPGRKQICF
jgi:hypothetical protein